MIPIRSAIGQQVFGLVLMAASIAGTIWEWRTAANERYYYPKAAMLFPVTAAAGLGMVLFPIDYDKLKAEHGVDRIKVFRHLPPIWKFWGFLALAAGLLNWYAIANM